MYSTFLGTGKTMLMDLFYDALPDDLPKKRVHFHAFMMEIHSSKKRHISLYSNLTLNRNPSIENASR
jgi:protein AFG1